MRRLARVLLLLAMAASLALTGFNLSRLADTGLGRGVLERTADEFSAALERQIARAATAEALAARLEALLGEEPRNWVAIKALTALAEERSIVLPANLVDAIAAADDDDHGLSAWALSCANCAYDARQCPLSPVLACQAPAVLTPLGDVLVVARESGNYLFGEEVDALDLGLSVIGLGAVALVPLSGGTSYTISIGARVAKLARRMEVLSPRLQATLLDAMRRGVDWGAVTRARSRDDISRALHPEVLRPVGLILNDANRLRRILGPEEALSVLRHIDNPAEARLLANAAEAAGPRMLGPLELLGKSRFLRVMMRLADEVWYAVAGFLAFIGSLTSLITSAVTSAMMRRARRALDMRAE